MRRPRTGRRQLHCRRRSSARSHDRAAQPQVPLTGWHLGCWGPNSGRTCRAADRVVRAGLALRGFPPILGRLGGTDCPTSQPDKDLPTSPTLPDYPVLCSVAVLFPRPKIRPGGSGFFSLYRCKACADSSQVNNPAWGVGCTALHPVRRFRGDTTGRGQTRHTAGSRRGA